MAKLTDWPERLMRWHAAACALGPMAWGQDDCALISAAAVEAQTGRHPAPELIGRYKTQRGAMGFIRRAGGLGAVADKHLGARLENPALAQRGDVVLTRLPDGEERLGVNLGREITIRSLEGGMVDFPLGEVELLAAWPVGRDAAAPSRHPRERR